MKNIHVNQLGYRTNDPKKAIVTQNESKFQVVRVKDGAVVFEKNLGNEIYDAASEEKVRVADFSEFSEDGEFLIRTASGDSFPFLIGENPYGDFRAALLEMFNYQKCGVDLDCGLWSHPACHTSLATIYGTNEKKDVSGGWHDAGDYGRYVVPAAMTVAQLLLAQELSPKPASDILDVTWFELEWMLKMQCEKTGGVYHKVSCKSFDALDEMPHDEHEELVLSPMSLTATADFAATMALASRFYRHKKEALIAAALRAWKWCEANPDLPGFENPPEISTGGYGDSNSKDELFWAACELFSATGEKKFHDFIKSSEIFVGLGWGNMGTYGIVSYLQLANKGALSIDTALADTMKAKLRAECDKIIAKYKTEPYGTSLGTSYPWGSNMVVGNNAMTLLLYNLLVEKDPLRSEAALEHMHYLLGRNPLSISYVTGYGSNAAKNPHHRPSVAIGKATPGMVVGGPNSSKANDDALRTHCKNSPPSKSYVDHQDSYSANEITIYWNSPAYFVASVLGM
ncbi:MAG: glycoside hydrolase family 9 protein [Defluviitaleaceae bacterium]|nr:glycoside hydrolase family 9 protein [Defluviitaleaceae bacterium]